MLTSSTFNTLMYSKTSSYEAPRPQLVLDSTIEIVDRRNDRTETVRNATKGNRAEQLLCDHATLLLSIADIAQSEIQQCPSALLEDDSKDALLAPHHHRRITPSSLPTFPKHLEGNTMGSKPNLLLLPRNESLRHSILLGSSSQRHRSVSFDSPTSVMKNIIHPWESTSPSSTSPLSLPRSPKNCRTPRLVDEQEKVTTKRSNKSHHPLYQSSSKKPRLESSPRPTSSAYRCRTKKLLPQVSALLSPRITSSSQSSANSTTVAGATKQQALQGTPPEGITIRKVYRRKFSWKNYPQLEEFLISNREAYLRHSALNYTIEQKNYNNTLTQDLLSLATKNGYIFDASDFTFVTVRDRIRCYYKSYVQSAKKRGILMGYAAKKAGLLSIAATTHPKACNQHDEDYDEEEDMNNSWSDTDSDAIEIR